MRHVDGIWLDRLTMGSAVQSIAVSGSTLSPESVPRYLRSLAVDPALRGGRIDDFVIEQPRLEDGKRVPGAGRLSFRAGRRGLLVPAATAASSDKAEERS
jgi:hypothetical protein